MIRSMTGYGRAQAVINGMDITVELKSVNHRYYEFSARIPRAYGFLDEKLKSYVQTRVSRGKIECYVQIEEIDSADAVVQVNPSLAAGYINALNSLAQQYGLANDVTATNISRYPDVLSVHREEADEGKIWEAVRTVAEKAAGVFVSMREAEGKRLKEDILSRTNTILKSVELVEVRSPETVKEYNAKLRARISEVLADVQVDEQRILTEAAIYADKIAVAEETVRLRSHIDQFKSFLESDEAIGRKMDFLVQEMNREANTIGSKAQDIDIVRTVVDIKSEIEKIREQVQNIE